jgi:hypothetical protein
MIDAHRRLGLPCGPRSYFDRLPARAAEAPGTSESLLLIAVMKRFDNATSRVHAHPRPQPSIPRRDRLRTNQGAGLLPKCGS